MKTLLSISAAALMLASAGAFAQTTSSTTNPTISDRPALWEDPTVMGAFYTDETLETLRPAEEIRTAWMDLTDDNRAALTEECAQTESIKMQEFCGVVAEF